MTYVISRLCRDCVDGACIPVCPVPECIVVHRPQDRTSELPNQLLINPEECIHCGACEPECPWEAIFSEDDVPERFREDVALNALVAAKPQEFIGAAFRKSRTPTAGEVVANKLRWEKDEAG